jgi:hypothetical protein
MYARSATTTRDAMTEHRKLAVHRLDSSEPVILWQHGSAWRSGSSKRTRWSMTERNRIVKCVSLLPVGRPLDARATSGTSFAVLPDNGLAALSVDDETPTDTCQRMTRSVRRLHKCLGERLCILSAAPGVVCARVLSKSQPISCTAAADCPVRSCAAAWCFVDGVSFLSCILYGG